MYQILTHGYTQTKDIYIKHFPKQHVMIISERIIHHFTTKS